MGRSADTSESILTKVPQVDTTDAQRLFYIKLSPGAQRCVCMTVPEKNCLETAIAGRPRCC